LVSLGALLYLFVLEDQDWQFFSRFSLGFPRLTPLV
jgi:hypothetical protein